MRDILQTIARENFRQSGYITHPGRERRTRWSFSTPPRSPCLHTSAVLGAVQRREQARARVDSHTPTSFLKSLIHALVRR